MKCVKVIAVGIALTASVIFAAEDSSTSNLPVRRHIPKAELEAARYRHTGGMIARPGTMVGEIVYVDAQKSASREWIQESADLFMQKIKVKTSVREGSFSLPSPKIMGNATLFVIDDETMPRLLAAPEDRWVMVNVAPLKKGAGEKEPFFKARVRKELTRGIAMLAGAQKSNYPGSLMDCITKSSDLDRFADSSLPVDVVARFNDYVVGYGIKPRVDVTYKKAIEEGWGPSPTNDVQQAIWDKVHQIPTKGIEIKFDPKKGK